jgi:hypothetical protein
MSSRRQTTALVAALSATTLALATLPTASVRADDPPAGGAFRFGLGDHMTVLVQPRHLKVGLAGRERNWEYLKHGIHELEEALEHAGKAVPKWRDLDIAALIEGATKAPIEAVEKAIEKKDGAAFDTAFRQLTDGCNACHQSAKVGMIVIQVPKGPSPFLNQDLAPAGRK